MKNFQSIREMDVLSQDELLLIDGGYFLQPVLFDGSFLKSTINFIVGLGEGLRDGVETAKKNWN